MIPDADLLNDLRHVAEELGHTPSQKKYDDFGKHNHGTLVRHFGSWREACEEAGLEPNEFSHEVVDDPEDLLDNLRHVAEELGRTPSASEYGEFGKHSYRTLARYFGSWRGACEEAGLEPNTGPVDDSKDLLDDLRRVADELGYTPSAPKYTEQGKYSYRPLLNSFGSWRGACEEAGLEPNTGPVDDSKDLLDDLRRIAEELGHTPSQLEYDELGKYNSGTLIRHFDSWRKACEEAGLDPNEFSREGADPRLRDDKWLRKQYLGKSYRLKRSPMSAGAVVALYGMRFVPLVLRRGPGASTQK